MPSNRPPGCICLERDLTVRGCPVHDTLTVQIKRAIRDENARIRTVYIDRRKARQ